MDECMAGDRIILLNWLRDQTGVWSKHLTKHQVCSLLTKVGNGEIFAMKNRERYGTRIIDTMDDTQSDDRDKILQLEALLADMTRQKTQLEKLLASNIEPKAPFEYPLEDLKQQIESLKNMIPAHRDITEDIQRAVTTALDSYRREVVDPLMNRLVEKNNEYINKLKALTDTLATTSYDESGTDNLANSIMNLTKNLQDHPGAFKKEADSLIEYLKEFRSSLSSLNNYPDMSNEVEKLKAENQRLIDQLSGMKDIKDYKLLQQKIDELEETIVKHQRAEEELKNKLDADEVNYSEKKDLLTNEHNRMYEECNKKLEYERTRVIQLEKQIEEDKEEIRRLQAQIERPEVVQDRADDIQKELDEKKNRIDELTLRIKELEDKIDSDTSSTRIMDLEKQINAKEKQIDDYELKIKELQDKIDQAPTSSKVTELEQQIDEKIKRIEECEDKLRILQDKIDSDTSASKLRELESQLTEKQDRLDKLQSDYDKLSQELKLCHESMSNKTDQIIEDYQKRIDESIQKLEECMKQQSKIIEDYEKRVESLEQHSKDDLSIREELEAKLNTQKEELIAKYESEIQDYKNELLKKDEFIKLLQQQIEEKGDVDKEALRLQDHIKDLENKVSALEEALNECNRMKDQKDAELAQKNLEIEELKGTIIELDKCKALNEEIVKQREEEIANLTRCKEEKEELTKMIEKLQDDIRSLRTTNDEANSYKVLLNEARDKLEQMKSDYDRQILEKEKEIASCLEENKLLVSRTNAAESQLEALSKELETIMTKDQDTIKNLEKIISERDQLLKDKEEECLERIKREIDAIKTSYVKDTEVLPKVAISECDEIRKTLPEVASRIKSMSGLIRTNISGIRKELRKPNNKAKTNPFIAGLVERQMPLIDTTESGLDDFDSNYNTNIYDDCEKLVPSNMRYNKLLTDLKVADPEIADLYETLAGIGRIYVKIRPKLKGKDTDKRLAKEVELDDYTIQLCETGQSFGPFDWVFPDKCKTSDLFKKLVNALDNLSNGYNLVLLSYGQSGSGKTYTLLGERDPKTNKFTPGLFSYVCNYLNSSEIVEGPKQQKDINVRMYQLYRKQIYDIFSTPPKRKRVYVDEETFDLSARGSADITNMAYKELSSFTEPLVDYFEARRFQRKTNTNDNSSRSHAFIELSVKIKGLEDRVAIVFCDLGGAEDLKQFEVGAIAKGEGADIVKSLLDLRTILSRYGSGLGMDPAGGVYSGNALRNILDNYLALDPSKPRKGKKKTTSLNKFFMFIAVRGYEPIDTNKHESEIAKKTTRDTLKFAQELRTGRS